MKPSELKDIENIVLNNRRNAILIDAQISKLDSVKERLALEISSFLDTKCLGIEGIKKLEVDASSPHYRYFNHKSREYEAVERLIRVAKAYR